MGTPSRIALSLLTLVFASPAVAQVYAPGSSTPVIGPSFVPSPETPDRQAPSSALFAGAGKGLGVSRRAFTEEDGSQIVRKGLVGSWAISQGLSAGVGLFSVTGDARKQAEFKRTWNVKDVTPKNDHIAAVGVSLRF